MDDTFYSVEQIARMLHMHPKTIQRYIREGKLRAVKIGKGWRITGHDVSRFTEAHCASAGADAAPPPPEERTRASAVLDIAACGREDADRLVRHLNVAMHSKPPEYGRSSLVTQYLEEEHTLRLTLWGNLSFAAAVLTMAEQFLAQTEEEEE